MRNNSLTLTGALSPVRALANMSQSKIKVDKAVVRPSNGQLIPQELGLYMEEITMSVSCCCKPEAAGILQVDLDGDEMTRVIWKDIKEKVCFLITMNRVLT